MPLARVFIPISWLAGNKYWAVRGRMCSADTLGTSTDPLAFQERWRASMLLFLRKILGKHTSYCQQMLEVKTGCRTWEDTCCFYVEVTRLNCQEMSLILSWLAAFAVNGSSLSSCKVCWPVMIISVLETIRMWAWIEKDNVKRRAFIFIELLQPPGTIFHCIQH